MIVIMMLTARDINNKKFEQTRPGYSPNEVDDFLREIALQITNYQKEREETAKKIEVLVESVREYKKDEEALKDALIGAQKQSRMVISEANVNAEKILAEATVKAGEIIGGTKMQLEAEKSNLARMKREVNEFKSNLLTMYKSHLSNITSMPEYDEESIYQDPLKSEISDSRIDKMASSKDDFDATRVIETSSGSSSSFNETINTNNRSSNKFGDLKFGENR